MNGGERSYTVTEVAIAARCPRQLCLHREGYRVRLLGEAEAGIGRAAHGLLRRLCQEAPRSAQLLRALAAVPAGAAGGQEGAVTQPEDAARGPEGAAASDEALRRVLYGLVHRDLFPLVLQLLPSHSAAELGRLDGVMRSLAALLATLLGRARRGGVPAAEVVARVLQGSEQKVRIPVPGVAGAVVAGQIDLLCQDVAPPGGRTWLWELKTFPADCDDPAPAV